MKLWAGRFLGETAGVVDDFNSSIGVDQRMYREDITGSMVHAQMLGRQGVISGEDVAQIVEGLGSILDDLDTGALEIDPNAEDIHMFVEAVLTQRIGEAGKRLHTGRSRNDQVAQDTKSYLLTQIDQLDQLISQLLLVIYNQANAHKGTILPGYTHLQRAQPIPFGHHLLAYGQMFLRDQSRLADCKERMLWESPLGSGALAGTSYPIDRPYTAKETGYYAPSSNSLDGVSDRDYVIELASCMALVMMHLSRFSEEVILWCSWEFRFVQLDDAFATGSSIMPQKKNPDVAELVRGKTGRVYGDLMALLTLMKGLPLAYNKDMQEDKEAIFDSVDTVKACLAAFTPMIATMTVEKENMYQAASKGFLNATDCADYLVGKGMAFRDGYQIVGRLVTLCIEKGCTLEALPLEDYQQHSPLFGEDLYPAIALERCVAARGSFGGAADVERQLVELKEMLMKKGVTVC